MLQFVYREPSAAQAQLMATHNLGGHGPHSSFDVVKYMADYKEKMRPTIVAAMKAGVHYANVTAVPAYCVGDVAHHIAQSAYNMFNDDMVFAIYEAVTGVLENTLEPLPSRPTPSRAPTTCSPSPPAPPPVRRRTSCGWTASPSRW